MKLIVAATGTLLLAGAAALAGWWFYWPIYQVQSEVRARLSDPESARFRDVSFNRAKRAGCGWVNAKNRMGGYVGNTHFIIFPDGDLRFEPADTEFGSSEQKIENLQKQINYLTLVESNCAKANSR